MTIQLDPETERLIEREVQAGHATSALDLVNRAVRAYVLGRDRGAVLWEADSAESRRQRRLAAAERIRELRKGLTLGPGLTIRSLIEEGRRW